MKDKPKHILIVEDERSIRQGLVDFLEYHDFVISQAEDGLAAQRMVAQGSFDVILLDLMLPKISGEQLCVQWRQEDMPTPIIMLTAKGLERERVAGLNLGADDYVTKPFSLEELLARINAVLRRTDPARAVGRAFEFGPWRVDTAKLEANNGDEQIEISKREAAIMQYFAANAGRVISRKELYENIWAEQMSELGTRTVDMHIARLRSKIEQRPSQPQVIQTVRGAGYIYKSQ